MVMKAAVIITALGCTLSSGLAYAAEQSPSHPTTGHPAMLTDTECNGVRMDAASGGDVLTADKAGAQMTGDRCDFWRAEARFRASSFFSSALDKLLGKEPALARTTATPCAEIAGTVSLTSGSKTLAVGIMRVVEVEFILDDDQTATRCSGTNPLISKLGRRDKDHAHSQATPGLVHTGRSCSLLVAL
jgi:hypothetical protein